MKKIWTSLCCAVALAGCNEAQTDPTLTPIFLLCPVTWNNADSTTKNVEILIKITPPNGYQETLLFYNWKDYRFASPCRNSGYNCTLDMSNELIEELGVMKSDSDGSVLGQRYTRIDRVTGEIKAVTIVPNLKEITLFEGTCGPGEEPATVETKF